VARLGLKRSGVTAWAAALSSPRAISRRQAKAAQEMSARNFRPVAGPVTTRGKTPTKSYISTTISACREAAETGKKSLMELKQLWLMSR
jgi:hypothetical protein